MMRNLCPRRFRGWISTAARDRAGAAKELKKTRRRRWRRRPALRVNFRRPARRPLRLTARVPRARARRTASPSPCDGMKPPSRPRPLLLLVRLRLGVGHGCRGRERGRLCFDAHRRRRRKGGSSRRFAVRRPPPSSSSFAAASCARRPAPGLQLLPQDGHVRLRQQVPLRAPRGPGASHQVQRAGAAPEARGTALRLVSPLPPECTFPLFFSFFFLPGLDRGAHLFLSLFPSLSLPLPFSLPVLSLHQFHEASQVRLRRVVQVRPP